jgi:hypothetical protein
MKKIYLLSFFISLFALQLKAVELQLSNETGNRGAQVTIKLTTKGFTNVIGVQFSINFDPAVLQYVAHTTSNPVATGYDFGTNNTALGQIAGVWIDPALIGLSVSDNIELMRVTFTIIGGLGTTTPVTISDTPTPFVALDGGLAYATTTFVNGSVSVASVLSTDLSSFTAKWRNPSSTDIVWQTASETNTAKFDIEQSTNGTHFQIIGSVKAKGISTTPQYYSFTHENPESTLNYYRLKMVDTDAQSKYSKTLAVNAETKGLIAVQKRGNQLSISGLETNREVDISVSDVMGRIVFSSKKATNTEGVLMASMPYLISGMYVFTMRTNQNLQFTKFLWTNDN